MKFLPLVIVLLCLPAPLSAEMVPEAKAMVGATIVDDDFESVGSRRALVEATAAYCERFSASLPRNSPADAAWLEGELKGEGRRTVDALGSVQFARHLGSRFVRECLTFAAIAADNPSNAKALIGLAIAFERVDDNLMRLEGQNGITREGYAFDIGLGIVSSAFMRAAFRSL